MSLSIDELQDMAEEAIKLYGKRKNLEHALKIAGRVDSSLKKACLDADENLGKLAKTAEKIGKAAKVAAGVTAAAATAVGVAAVKSYTEHEQAVNSMAAATGAAGEELEHLQAAMEGVYQNNFGDSLPGRGGRCGHGGPEPEKHIPG